MEKTNATMAQHEQLSSLMNSLTEIQMKMSRVKTTFPNYYQQLQRTYNQILVHAKNANMMPPWMAA